ncbi:MAG: capsular biosynthesis protein, partial [Verrucomicrobiae bacterium]|nr:capsular biosynthesis protein [Verrucomicrobiae bacterium]
MEVATTQPSGSTELHFLDYWRVIRIRKSVIIIVLLLVVMTVTVVTFLLPPVYRSTARISVEKDAADIGTIGGQALYQGYDPYFLSTQFEIIQSKSVLYPVIERMDLNHKWAKRYGAGDALKQSDTIRFLQGKLGLRKSRDTSR